MDDAERRLLAELNELFAGALVPHGIPADPPTWVVAPERNPSFFVLVNGKPVPLPEPTTLGSGATLPQQPQHHNHEAHPRQTRCRTRARQGRRSHLRIFQHQPKKKNNI